MKRNIDLALLILRLAVGLLMLLHGIAKMNGISSVEGMLTSNGLPSFLAYGVYVTEIIAPLFLVVGYRTRLAAVVYAMGVLTAVFLAHPSDIFSLSKHGGWEIELLGLYFFGALALVISGGGKYAFSSKSGWD